MATKKIVFTSTTGQTGLNIILSTFNQTYWDGTNTTQATYATAVTSGKISIAEHQASGVYYATMPDAVPDGRYLILILNSSDVKIMSFIFVWDDTNEDEGYLKGDASGRIDVSKIDGNKTDGNNATLNLKQLSIVNSAGDAIIAKSTGNNGKGIIATGDGTGQGFAAIGAGTGAGIKGSSVSGGPGAELIATGPSAGLAVSSIGGSGATFIAAGSGVGISVAGSGVGEGIKVTGGVNADAVLLTAGFLTNQSGVAIVSPHPSGDGIKITNGASGEAINFSGFTAGGTTTFEALLKLLASNLGGTVRDKSGSPGILEYLDLDDSTVIYELDWETATPYRIVTKI